MGTKKELKALVSHGEKITVEIQSISEELLIELRVMKNVSSAVFKNGLLTICLAKGGNGLINLLEFIKQKGVAMDRIYSELPTLNDVFLELTGKELRD